jgi:hypothetical protein
MPNYYVNIIDTQNNEYTTVLENAAKSSLVLSYKGKDQKDDLAIIGSAFSFTLNVPLGNSTDAAFLHLFTGDEQRHKIELRREDDNFLIWHGFLLPDQYSEPYKNGTYFINFEASDGLGRLKGKFLPAAFYKETKTVTSIIAECLKLTGLNMPFYFSPSIENTNNKNFHQIYINTSIFQDGKKQDDAHKILTRLAENLLFCVYQSLGRWHCEGLNKRNLLIYKCKHYDVDGEYIEDLEVTRNIKDINQHAMATPTITMVPPYGLVRVNNQREPVQLPETLATEENNGWAVVTGVVGEIHVTDWWGTFLPKAKEPNYNVWFYNNNTNNFLESVYVKLLRQIYLQKGQKYKISFKLTIIDTVVNQNNNTVTSWNDPIRYQIKLNDVVLYNNYIGDITERERIRFRNGKTASNTFEFVVPNNGLLDIVFFQPYNNNVEMVAIQVDEVSIEEIGFVEEEIFSSTANADYTIVKDVDIDLADDATAFTDGFLLQPLHNPGFPVNQITVPILYTFTQNGKHYSVVQLDGANLIDENPETSFHQTEEVNIEGVIYNYENGEQMCVVHDFPDLTGNFIVNKAYLVQGDANRDTWYQWTDSVYEIESNRFGEVYKNVLRRMFTVPHPKIDVTVKVPIAFNDIIKFNYIEQSNFFVTNLRSWDIDKGRVTLIINKAVYQNDDTVNPGENIPPFVEAGPTIYIAEGVTTANLTCVATDPDGFIAAFAWSQDTTVPGVTIVSPFNQSTVVNGLTEDFYTFRITVTDNDGATAFDTVNVIRILDYDFALELTNDVYQEVENEEFQVVLNTHRKDYDLTITPTLQDNLNVNITGYYRMAFSGDPANIVTASASVELTKNTVALISDFKSLSSLGTDFYDVITPLQFNLNNTDTITLRLEGDAEVIAPGQSATVNMDFVIEAINIVNGQGNIITTFPIEESISLSASTL